MRAGAAPSAPAHRSAPRRSHGRHRRGPEPHGAPLWEDGRAGRTSNASRAAAGSGGPSALGGAARRAIVRAGRTSTPAWWGGGIAARSGAARRPARAGDSREPSASGTNRESRGRKVLAQREEPAPHAVHGVDSTSTVETTPRTAPAIDPLPTQPQFVPPHRRRAQRAQGGRVRALTRTSRPKAARRRNRRRPTLPGPCEPSTIGAVGLNCSVRNGKRCFPHAIATGNCSRPTPAAAGGARCARSLKTTQLANETEYQSVKPSTH